MTRESLRGYGRQRNPCSNGLWSGDSSCWSRRSWMTMASVSRIRTGTSLSMGSRAARTAQATGLGRGPTEHPEGTLGSGGQGYGDSGLCLPLGRCGSDEETASVWKSDMGRTEGGRGFPHQVPGMRARGHVASAAICKGCSGDRVNLCRRRFAC